MCRLDQLCTERNAFKVNASIVWLRCVQFYFHFRSLCDPFREALRPLYHSERARVLQWASCACHCTQRDAIYAMCWSRFKESLWGHIRFLVFYLIVDLLLFLSFFLASFLASFLSSFLLYCLFINVFMFNLLWSKATNPRVLRPPACQPAVYTASSCDNYVLHIVSALTEIALSLRDQWSRKRALTRSCRVQQAVYLKRHRMPDAVPVGFWS